MEWVIAGLVVMVVVSFFIGRVSKTTRRDGISWEELEIDRLYLVWKFWRGDSMNVAVFHDPPVGSYFTVYVPLHKTLEPISYVRKVLVNGRPELVPTTPTILIDLRD